MDTGGDGDVRGVGRAKEVSCRLLKMSAGCRVDSELYLRVEYRSERM